MTMICQLTTDELDAVAGGLNGNVSQIAEATSAAGGMEAVVGLIAVANYVVGLADGATATQSKK